jgi:flagellar basal-body rod protein FlgB
MKTYMARIVLRFGKPKDEGTTMAIRFDNALGVHPQALRLRERRTELIAANLANADTPNYKARDLDFQSVLKGVQSPAVNLALTRPDHLAASTRPFGAELKYRVPSQASLDGNTVDSEQEQVRFAENALQYQVSLRFLDGKIADLKSAIKGE